MKRAQSLSSVALRVTMSLAIMFLPVQIGTFKSVNKAIAAPGRNQPGGLPDYLGGIYPNWAQSPTLRKFVDSLPGVGAANANNLGQYIPLAVADKSSYPGSDYYQIGLTDYTEQMHSDLPATKLRGYKDLQATGTDALNHYLGPIILARQGTPVRIKFVNLLGIGTAGDLFIPVDSTTMGAGMGPDGMNIYTQNRADLHLHGGDNPWISDGTPHQWVTPANESTTPYTKGVSFENVPDMIGPGKAIPNPSKNDGMGTYFYPNGVSSRLMFYHDHAFGITRLNVYAGEAAGYILVDPQEDSLINAGTLPNQGGGVYNYGIPLIIQDKTFVDAATIPSLDPTWNWGTTAPVPHSGDLWYPHVYMPNQNPNVLSGANPMGKWDYGPWFWPPLTTASGLRHGPVIDPVTGQQIPGVPDNSSVMESFQDTPIVNGCAYPFIPVGKKAYRFRILNAANDRSLNLQLYYADTGGGGMGAQATAVVSPAGVITGINVVNGGTGYNTSTSVNITDVSGTGATATATISAGVITAVVVTNGGTGYSTSPVITFASGGPGGSGAQATATVLNGGVSAIAVASGGTGYTSPPGVMLIGGGGNGAVANSTINPATGAVTGITVTVPGTGYTSAPSVIIGGDTEVKMVPAVPNAGLPATWPTDGRVGGVPDPTTAGPKMIQIGSEGGFLPAPVVLDNTPVGYEYNRKNIVVLDVNRRTLQLLGAERADVIIDFTNVPDGTKVILYNDAPTPMPAFDVRLDYYTGHPDYSFATGDGTGGAPTTLPGYGPNTRTIAQFRVSAALGTDPAPYNVAPLQTALVPIFASTQPVAIVPESTYPAGTPSFAPTDTYSAIQANSLSFTSATTVGSVTVTNGGTGYTAASPAISINGIGTGATAVATVTNGVITAINVTSGGTGYDATTTVAITGSGTGATAAATVTNGIVTRITVTSGGTGYASDLAVVFSGGGGTGAAAVATVTNGIITFIQVTNPGSGYTAAPAVAITGAGGTGATATAALGMPMLPKAIQELFELDYGRMNTTLGVELPLTNFNTQTTIPYGYIDPPTEIIQPDAPQVWKVTHNGVDTHAVHFHLFNVQVINRVGWDGAIRPPEPNELGWKETVRMSPLEDCIVALKPRQPVTPFNIPDSIRPLNPAMPLGSTLGFSGVDPNNNPVVVTNDVTNFGWEYVWHCHMLDHEEMDMMRPVVFQAPAIPGKPGAVTAAASSAGATVSFQYPLHSLSSPITGYTVTASPGGRTATGTVSPIAVTGLTNGQTYTFTVRATNILGTGQDSDPSNAVTPEAVPGAPTAVTAVAGNAQATISFTAPTGGTTPIISYTVTSNPGSITATGASSPITMLGLTNGTSYTFTVTADNAFGTGPASNPSNAVIPNAPGVPAAPTGLRAFAGNTRAYVTFTPPAATALPITAYTATSTPGGRTGTASVGPITVNGLTNGTSYTFRVTATNALGTSPNSAASNAVTPATVTPPGPPTGAAATAGIRQAVVRFTAPLSNGSAITSYTVTATPGGRTATGAASPLTVTGLTNGTAYTFAVTATNARGTGPASSPSASITLAAVPDAPTGVIAVAGNTQAQVSFVAPLSNGGSPITSYRVTASPGGGTATGAASPLTVTGLTNGTAYTFAVVAINAAGTGPASAASNSVTPGAPPGAPTIGTATPGNGQAVVTFTAPASTGGSPITGYTVTSSGAIPVIVTGSSSPITVLGLTNGTAYTFTVTAKNANGTSAPSAATASVTPATVPNSPTAVTAVAGNAQTVVSFTAPVATGGSAITGYNVISVPGSITATGLASPITVTGLINGNPYTFIVKAVNAIGMSAASAPSNSVIPGGAPGAPTGVTAVASGTSAIVSFTAPAAGGSAILSYTVTSSGTVPLTATGTASPITVPGLVLGTTYTFTVTATTALGTGPASAPSNAITPAAVPGAPTAVTAVAGNASATVNFTAPASTGGSPITSYTVTSSPGSIIAVGTSGPITVNGLTNGTPYTFSVTATNAAGTGPAGLSNSVTPSATVPGAPTSVSAVAGNASAAVSFTAPASNGGSPITGYTVTSSGAVPVTATGTVSPITVTGLTNGTAYTFTVTATNANGTGAASTPSNSVTPVAVPGAPTGVTAVAGNAQATVSFTAPASNGGSPILLYTVTSNSVPAISAVGVASPIIVTGLANGTAYTFTVTATNAFGTSLASAPSASVTPAPPITQPGAPTSVIAVPGNGQASVIATPPVSTGGAPITSYTVTSSPGALTGTGAAFPITVVGLTNGVAYTFTVTAANSVGSGPASSPSNIVTPAVIPSAAGATSMAVGNLDANPLKDVIVDFGAGNGIWIYYNNSTWVKLHSISAVSIVVGNVDGLGGDDVVIDFGPAYGLWIYYNNSSWIQLHNLSAISMLTAKLDASGKDAVVVNFGGTFGVWVYFNGTGWVQINTVAAGSMAKGNVDGIGTDDLIIDFGATYGIWVYYNATTWSQLHVLSGQSIITARLDATGRDAVVVNFGGTNGIWVYSNNSVWTQLHTIAAVSMAKGNVDGTGTDDLIIDFGAAYGIWGYFNNTTWSLLSASTGKSSLTATLDATGKDAVVVNFGGANGIQGYFNNSTFVKLAA